MKLKTFFRVTILVVFILFIGKFVIFGERGFLKYLQVEKEIKIEKKKILKVGRKIENLKSKIERWQADDFKLEKMARQKLQMGFANEKVYFLG